ncbi:MAG: GNAT family N-acetyltransferase [Dermatophilus congolensis]|nr:GNAT family N-acetyltransferase [Dermatophilus congolensis]
MALSLTAARFAEPEDLAFVQQIEAAADTQFAEHMDTSAWGEPPTGESRATNGIVLVIGQPAVGFAHVITLDGRYHLDALAVRPEFQRRSLGSRLLRAAYGVIADRGGDEITLTTFAEMPWNAPWYERQGFEVLADPLPAGLEAIREHERAAGLDDGGRRVVMRRSIVDTPTPIPAVSVLPVRDGPHGLEVFVQHRVGTMDFVPNAVVFPGGRIDPGDAELGAALDLPQHLVADHENAWARTAHDRIGGGATASRTLLATAMREVEEETGARIDPTHLIPWDDWETPIGYPKRFDVRFFLLPVHDPAVAETFAHTTTEAHRSHWMPAREVEAGAENGSLILVAPTRILVEELATLHTVAAAEALRPRVELVRHDMSPTPARRGRLA